MILLYLSVRTFFGQVLLDKNFIAISSASKKQEPPSAPASHLLYSVIKIASHKEGKGFYFAPETTIGIIFGELEAPFDSERVQAIEELFGRTEIHFRATKYIREEVWSKYRLNVCNNLPQAILGAGVGCYRDSVHMKKISDKLYNGLIN